METLQTTYGHELAETDRQAHVIERARREAAKGVEQECGIAPESGEARAA